MTRQYSAAASQAGNAVEKTADLWTQGVRKVLDRTYLVPRLPQVDLIPAVERYFAFVQRAVDMNRVLTVKWVQAASALSGTVRDEAASAGNAVRGRAESVGGAVREKAGTVEQAAREQAARAAHEQAEKAAQAEHDLAREARKVEREQARRAQRRPVSATRA